MTTIDGPQPLDGVRVVDLSLLIPGPWATSMLADLGADVVHVQPPGGDPLQDMMPGAYRVVGRGKKVVLLDLKSEEGRGRLLDLLRDCDVLVEGFRPGTLQRLGFAPDSIMAMFPRLIVCSLNGYGSEGTYRDRPGHDLNYLAASGLLSMSGEPSGRPYPGGGVPVADLAGSLFATQGILAALLLRQQTGVGSRLDVPLAAAALKLSEPRMAEYDERGGPAKAELMSRGAYDVFRCRDGSWLAVACMEDRFWRGLCRVLGREDWLEREEYSSYSGRCHHAERLNADLADEFARADRDVWVERCVAADLPVNAVLDFGEIGDDVHMRQWLDRVPNERGRSVRLPYALLVAERTTTTQDAGRTR